MLDRSDPHFAVSSFVFSLGVCCCKYNKILTRNKGERREENIINTGIKCEGGAEN
jgi:hypothetical protein